MSVPQFPILDLLDHPDDFPSAVEEHLVSPRLPDLLEQLALVHRPVDAALPGELRSRILSSGLSTLSEDEFGTLLSHPRGMLELQRAILLHGGAYWDGVIARSRGVVAVDPVVPAPDPNTASPAWYQSPWAWAANVLTGLAAALVVLAFGSSDSPTRQELAQKDRQVKALTEELAALSRQHPPTTPTDLPEASPLMAAPDPSDLPEGDPEDLPEGPGRQRAKLNL